MVCFLVEMKCPQHGLERFRIKVIKRYNMPADEIKPKLRTKPVPGSLSGLYVGRRVGEEKIKDYLIEYFRRKHMWESVIKIRMRT